VAITPDQCTAITVSQQPKLSFWDASTLQKVAEIEPAHETEALCVAVRECYAVAGLPGFVHHIYERTLILICFPLCVYDCHLAAKGLVFARIYSSQSR